MDVKISNERIGQEIDHIEDIMMYLEYEKEQRDEVWKWLRNIRDDISSFLREYGYEK